MGLTPMGMGVCGKPGPGGAHCTYLPGHSYACFDVTRRVAFSDREYFHYLCGDPGCPSNG